MIYLSFIWHMHQPYYRDLATEEIHLPWVRLHGIKDYLDMVKILKDFPRIHQTFNLVPSLIEQIQVYTSGAQDTFQALSYKKAQDLTHHDKQFILERFFSAQLENIISVHPRYLQLYLKNLAKQNFSTQDYLDLQAWFNLAWFDPYFQETIPELKKLINKARNFSEEDKHIILDKQIEVLKEIIPTYRDFQDSGQIEVTLSPYYHPITPLLYNTNTAKEANKATTLPKTGFSYPQDAQSQINQAVALYKEIFNRPPVGMWPSEEAVSDHIVPFIIEAGIKWIVTDEEILFKSLKKRRSAERLYKPYTIEKDKGSLSIVFRDRNLSDLIGFVYHKRGEHDAVSDFILHLRNISKGLKGRDALIVIAMDGENAWEYYKNDGWDFLGSLYDALSDEPEVKCITMSEYLNQNPPQDKIQRLAAGSWIYGNFNKWIGQEQKNKAWEYLALARQELAQYAISNTTEGSPKRTQESLRATEGNPKPAQEAIAKAWEQIYICEGSDWFWWYGDNNADFDYLYRKHLSNFYKFLGKNIPNYLNRPI